MWFYKKKGFTLLELMIVIIIVGILASLAVPRFIAATNKTKEGEAKAILGSIRSAQLRYYLEYDAYTTTIGNLDLTLTANPSTYYTYSAIDSGGNIGQAAKIPAGLNNFRINVVGTISTY